MSAKRLFPCGGVLVVAVSLLALVVQGDRPTAAKDEPPVFKAPPTEFECRWTDHVIKIDGKGSDPAWKNAQVIDRFYLPWLGKNVRVAKTGTKAKLLWDRDNLYFFADMEDSDLFALEKQHNGMTWEDDVFELFFKPTDDKPGYYEYQVNAAGTLLELFFPRRGAGGYRRFKNVTGNMEAKVHLRGTLNDWTDKDEGWSVEGKIPWKDFFRTGGRPQPGENWKFALCRYDYSVEFEGPELSTCAPLTQRDFHRFEDYAKLKFVGAKKEEEARRFGIDRRVPLTTSTVVGAPEPPPPFRVVKAYPKLKPEFPIFVVRQPGTDRLLLIAENRSYGPTKLQRMKDDPDAAELETLFSWDDGVAYSIEFHPDFPKNGQVFIGWNGTLPGDKVKKTRITRYHMDPQPPYTFDPKSAKDILAVVSDGHNGGAMAFGQDGMLYVTFGDGTSDSDTNVVGQKMDTLLAKLLRIDVDHPDEGKTYSVPKDNPFVGKPGIMPETWAYGFRNPWRLTVDKKTGHIWLGQNGQDLWEQAYLVNKGDNGGWSVMEGSHEFYTGRKPGPTPFVKPTVEHPHSEFRSLTGGVVYYGAKYPELQGAYIYGDYSTGKIWGIKHDGKKALWHKELASTTLAITSFGIDSRGELLITDHHAKGEGGIFRLEPTPKDSRVSTFPTKLSDSGLFQSVKGHVMMPAMIPYSVNAQLWSDGAYKERWLGLPGADTKIDMKERNGWEFPDKTVVVKSFALERELGKPETRRWIETRFLTKQDGQWYGYSYVWNDEQTEATLVPKEGMDREFSVGEKKQKWHYPSRTECMVCHSRAANFVLGLSTVQMNKVHDYGGVKEEQLRVLEHLGVFMSKVPAKNKKLVDPYDKTQDLDARARSYLHANCAICHVEAGGGNAQFNVDLLAKPDTVRLIDEKPQHNTFGLKDARLIAPGAPERSVLLYRVGMRDQGHMPPLGSFLVDHEAVAMLREWVTKMNEPLPDYRPVAGWPKVPADLPIGPVSAVAADSDGTIYILHRGKKPLVAFDRDGNFLRAWGDDVFKTGHGLRVDPEHNVWATDMNGHQVFKFDRTGKLLLTLGTRDKPGATHDLFNRPTDIAFAANGDFFVTDGYGNNRVVKFSKDGKYLKEWGKRGTGDGEFHLPHAIVIDKNGTLYVGDRENKRIQLFDTEGKYLGQWKESGAPYGLFLAGDRMFVADVLAGWVLVLDMHGKPIGRFGTKGTGPGQFRSPHMLCVDRDGAVFVAEVENKRVQKFVAK